MAKFEVSYSEAEMRDSVVSHLLQGEHLYNLDHCPEDRIHLEILTEVPLLNRRADIVIRKKEPGKHGVSYEAIECKLYDWRGAVEQAWIYKMTCHVSSICLPRSLAWYIAEREEEMFGFNGIGLYGYSQNVGKPLVRIFEPVRESHPTNEPCRYFHDAREKVDNALV